MESFKTNIILSNNIIIEDNYHYYHNEVIKKYNVIKYIKGHINCGIEKNPIWIILNNEEEIYLMFCEPDLLCLLCKESYNKILDFEKNNRNGKKFCWIRKNESNYVRANHNNSSIYIHQVIMNWYGNGSGTAGLSVDHIDRNPSNNKLENLRIATSEEQHSNSKGVFPNTKKGRRKDACVLPDNINQEYDFPKYITYNVNKYGKEKEFSREYFKIENHPLLNHRTWVTSTKKSISIKEKLQQAKDALEYLNKNGVLPDTPERELPQYVSYYIERGNHLLVWQKTSGENRLSKKITLEKDYYELDKKNQEEELKRLNKEIIKKYDNKYSIFNLNDNEINEIQKEKEIELPTYVRYQTFYDGLYLVFNKGKEDTRISITAKLPHNYNINKELYLLNKKIIDKFGIENSISLEKYHYDECDNKINIPEGMYISLKCKKPYLIMKIDIDTFSMELPNSYNLQEQIDYFNKLENKNKDLYLNIDEVKEILYNGKKPDNISICLKDKKYYQLQYKLKTKEQRHDKAVTIQKENININLELIKMNDFIINRYGKEYGILLCL